MCVVFGPAMVLEDFLVGEWMVGEERVLAWAVGVGVWMGFGYRSTVGWMERWTDSTRCRYEPRDLPPVFKVRSLRSRLPLFCRF